MFEPEHDQESLLLHDACMGRIFHYCKRHFFLCHVSCDEINHKILKPVFHFARTKVNVDWLVILIREHTRKYVIYKPLFNLRMLTDTLRYDTGEVENGL